MLKHREMMKLVEQLQVDTKLAAMELSAEEAAKFIAEAEYLIKEIVKNIKMQELLFKKTLKLHQKL